MKKRFIRLFMFAAAIASVGALNSCKDYDEDRINDLEHRLQDSEATVQNLLIQYKTAVDQQIAALNTAISQIRSCTCSGTTPSCNCPDIDAKIAAALAGLTPGISTADALQIANQAIADYMAAHPVQPGQPGLTAAEVNTLIQAALAGIQGCNCTGDALTTVQVSNLIANALNDFLVANPGLSAQEVQNMITTSLQNYATLTNLQDAKTELQNAYQAADTALKSEIQSEMEKALKIVNTAIATAQAKADEAYTLANQANTQANENKTALENLVKDLEQAFEEFQSGISTAQQTAISAKTIAEANEILINGLTETMATLATSEDVAKADAELQKQINKLAEDMKNFATQEDIVSTLRFAMDLYMESIQYTDETAADLQKQIDELLDKVKTTQTTIENTIINKLNDLMSRATSIVLQGTTNPAFGSFALPFGIQSNVLVALHGDNTKGAQKFPLPEYFPGASYETIKANATLLSDAGKVYLTINPSDVDFTGTELTLENSNGEASLFKLTPLALSDKTIKFGMTRGAAGFYEATVSIDKNQLENVQLGYGPVETMGSIAKDSKVLANALIDYVKNQTHNGVAASAKDLATVTNNVLDALSMDALAAKGTWTDNFGAHSITSNYGIAATAIRPLDFNSLDVLEGLNNVPGYGKTMKLVNRVYDKAESVVKNAMSGINFSSLSMTSINFDDNKADGTYTVHYNGPITVPVTVTIPAGSVTVSANGTLADYDVDIYDAGHDGDPAYIIGVAHITNAQASVSGSNSAPVVVTSTATSTIDITIDITSTINDIMGDANSSLSSINSMIDDINDMISDIDNATNKITNSTADLQTSLNNWMNKLNNNGTRVLRKVARLTKPAMIVISDNGTTLAGFPGHTPAVSGKVTLIPTTYSLEYLVPIYKKYVTVNGQKVEIGENGKIENVTLQKGLNEIRFAALDYAGNQEVRIYTVYAL